MSKGSEEARKTSGINLSIDAEEPTPFKTKHAACIAKILESTESGRIRRTSLSIEIK
jgi:hypothetical protein